MKNKLLVALIASGMVLGLVAGCSINSTPQATTVTAPTASLPLPTDTPVVFDPKMLLAQAVDSFLMAPSLQMNTHEITSYEANAANGSVRAIYGEFITTYDIRRSPELKIRVQSQFRFSP
ncbi:MAG: hypothetical protein H0S79_22230, partial [Anaerolineaceae bacterium]|nr:hypothetical protein [Anaerolineaceae bacterium]